MSRHLVSIRELAGWDFDTYAYRPEALTPEKVSQAASIVAQRSAFEQSNVVLPSATAQLHALFASHANRPDLLSEMSGLTWSLGAVDLRSLIAFQRRLAFSPEITQPSIPVAGDWPALTALSFGPPKPVECAITHDRSANTLILQSENPNLHFRVTDDPSYPLTVHAGGPFFEVARFRDRWFLRDGYHRAYALLKAGVFEVPAVIVEATNLEELGATQPWFFSQEVLFSNAPPHVADFLNDDLVLAYDRPALIKTLRITMEENLKPATPTGEQP